MYFKVDQTVYSPLYGEGIVIAIDYPGDWPIKVKFHGIGPENGDENAYTIDGKENDTDPYPALSQKPIVYIENKPLLEKGQMVWVKDNHEKGWICAEYLEPVGNRHRTCRFGDPKDQLVWDICLPFEPRPF